MRTKAASKEVAASQVNLRSLSPRHAQLLSLIWFNDSLSKSDLFARTGIRLRTVGTLVDDLVRWKMVKEDAPRVEGVGRPQVPLSVADDSGLLLGMSIIPGSISVASVNLKGTRVDRAETLATTRKDELVPAAVRLLKKYRSKETLAIGVSLSGFVDDTSNAWLLSSAHPSQEKIDLSPLVNAAGATPITINNELHAMSALARLQRKLGHGDALLIHLDDGRVASSILVDGKPNCGSVLAANELGHTTMPVATSRCYCGRVGCVERIFSSEFLQETANSKCLSELLASPAWAKRTKEMVDLTARAMANAINLVRPQMLLISTSLATTEDVRGKMQKAIATHTLEILNSRLEVQWMQWNPEMSATAAAMLAVSILL